ncbi:YfcE family phosphodiesterase [Treponema sp.]|uniref:YfcE family phosphodiesterase n=1 Tax=Treponema sp. TaxID=166 RepID=UPI0025DE1CC7|nr:YfcE family phosphodiesterase [Treponema sp.]MCR5217929.1 YfcE family phosphodiesterase [Treponema sp.]
MNNLNQQLNLLIGDTKEMESLENKDECTILIISDSHGQHYRLLDIVAKFGSECDSLIFCGDGCGDMIYLLEEAAADPEYAKCLPPVIGLVEGNNDSDSYSFAPSPDRISRIRCPLRNTMNACGHRIFFTHGHRCSLFYGSEALVEASRADNADIVLFGHTHVACNEFKAPGVNVINPGSISLPRSGQPPCFALLKLKRNSSFADIVFYQITASGYSPYIPSGFW